MKNADTYKEVKTLYFDGIVARVHIPDLTAEEHQRRRKNIEKAAIALLLSPKEPKQ